MARVVRTLFAFAFSILIALSPVLAQQAQNPDPASPPTAQKLTKEQKKKMGRALKELDAAHKLDDPNNPSQDLADLDSLAQAMRPTIQALPSTPNGYDINGVRSQ